MKCTLLNYGLGEWSLIEDGKRPSLYAKAKTEQLSPLELLMT